MAISPYLRELRAVVGTRLLFLPGVTAVVFDEEGRVLLGRRADDGTWALIAGVMDPGEQPAQTVVREVWEETAVHVVPERIVAVTTHPPNVYPNGDRTEYVDITFRCRATGGQARVNDDESLEVGWFAVDALPPLSDRQRTRIEWAQQPDAAAHFQV
ncbi:NUDIX domain-containing protein [Actinoplanes sp. TFC3]|uniref:NUDIX hydrolase n=1 Tax=Actinoplanes sp. TFC3 TaxID=1710355 RepID=UPI00082FA245|nr:NUDIX domain-containing protein [Actinoplanes sp. TFC3]